MSTSLKHTEAFRTIYRRGRWAHGALLSIGVFANPHGELRIGLRTRRGLKGAVVRNRLKRQLRVGIAATEGTIRRGVDMVIVIHPPTLPAKTTDLHHELTVLCNRLKILSRLKS